MTIAVVREKHSHNITMEGSASSSINSRSTAIRNILLTAWRAKLSNEEWESKIRKVLPRGVNGDVYDLADCLLKQALIGPVPNQLFMSYIKHAVQCELVSHSAVLSSIANQQINLRSSTLLYRTSPVVCLLEFLKTFRHQLSCRGTEVECLNLCQSLSELLHWLLRCMSTTADFINSLQQQQHQQSLGSGPGGGLPSTGFSSNPSTATMGASSGGALTTNSNVNSSISVNHHTSSSQLETSIGIIDLCAETIHYFVNRPFTKSLVFITRIEAPLEFEERISRVVPGIREKLNSCQHVQYVKVRAPHLQALEQLESTFTSKELHPSMVAAQQLRYLQTHRIRSTHITSSSNFERRIQQYNSSIANHDSSTNYALFNSLYPLVAFDAILRPARLNKHLARQIATITNFNSAPANMTYCELIRVCLIGLIDAHGNSKAKASWSFFTFLKLPRLLIELNKQFRRLAGQTVGQQPPMDHGQAQGFINDLKQAFERLCEYSPLLDEAEFKCNCDLFKCLIKELIKNDQALAQLKNLDCRKFPARRPVSMTNNSNPMGGHMMLKTEPVVTTMLETLNSEQDPIELFSILAQSCYGISFEYTLSAAAATGRLHLFVRRLIEHNELYKQPQENLTSNPRHVQAQALNFDITFLILTYIAQRYGPELIERDHASSATFNKWYHERYNHEASFKCPREMLKDSNDEIVASLIKQMLNRNSDIQMKLVNWHDVCTNLPKATSEIIGAWTMGALSDEDIALVIDRLRSRMCFMAVVAATWLQCYIKTLDEDDKAKPLYFLNCLTKPAGIKQQQQQQQESNSELKTEGFKERSGLLSAITKRIYFELVPSTPGSRSSGASSGNNNNTNNNEESQLEPASCRAHKDRFISTLTTQEIFTANVKQCLARGWIDYDSLNSLSSLFKIIGSKCFTSLIVEQILTSHESPSDLSRAVNITFGLFHLDIEACAFALIKNVIPTWLMSEKKQTLLNQPRAFALANLAVMTIIEVYDNLNSSNTMDDPPSPTSATTSGSSNAINMTMNNRPLNGIIKQEPGIMGTPLLIDSVDNASGIGAFNGAKRIKLSYDSAPSATAATATATSEQASQASKDNAARLSSLQSYLVELMRLFKEIVSDPMMDHRTLFPVLFLQQTVMCAREKSDMVTVHLQPDIVLDIIDLFSSELTFELVLAMSNMSSKNGRMFTAKAMCKLADIKESKQKTLPPQVGAPHQQPQHPQAQQGQNPTGATMNSSSTSTTGPELMNSQQQQPNTLAAGKMTKGAGNRAGGGESTPMMIG